MNNILFPDFRYIKVNVSGIKWDLDDVDEECDLPESIDDFEVEIDFNVDPYETWREDGGETGYDIMTEALVEQLSNEYGFCIEGIDNVKILG